LIGLRLLGDFDFLSFFFFVLPSFESDDFVLLFFFALSPDFSFFTLSLDLSFFFLTLLPEEEDLDFFFGDPSLDFFFSFFGFLSLLDFFLDLPFEVPRPARLST
jgi:hypothetical protein